MSWCSCNAEYAAEIVSCEAPEIVISEDGSFPSAGDSVLLESCSTDSELGLGSRFEENASVRTPLFDAIKRREWENVTVYLRTGKWTGIFFHDNFAHLRAPSRREQCRMWVLDEADGVARLPLHAAVLAEAPSAVLERLLYRYEKAIQCPDSSGRLPLGLALTVNTTDAALLTLVEAWPNAVARDMYKVPAGIHPKPADGDENVHSSRNEYLSIVVEQAKVEAQRKEDDVWKKIVSEAGMEIKEEDDLESVLSSLLAYRKCLRQHEAAFSSWNAEEASRKPSLGKQRSARSLRRKHDRKAEI